MKTARCSHCNETFQFDPKAVERTELVSESADAPPPEVTAYHVTCPKCGKRTTIPVPEQ